MDILATTLTASQTSDSFFVDHYDNYYVQMRDGGGTGFNGGTITMQSRPHASAGWDSYVIDGSAETWTDDDKRRYVDGGMEIRFVADASINDVDIWVAGNGVRLQNS